MLFERLSFKLQAINTRKKSTQLFNCLYFVANLEWFFSSIFFIDNIANKHLTTSNNNHHNYILKKKQDNK